MLIYGPAGSGKKALVAQAKDGYLFDFDNGMRTCLTLNDKFTHLRQEIEFDTYVDEPPSAPTAYMRAKQKLLSWKNDRSNLKYKAIVIDSLTGLCRAIQLFVMANSSGGMDSQPQIQHWGMMVREVESVFTLIRSMKLLILVTAHEMLVETDTTTLIRIMSATRPHGMNKIQWLFDEVLHSKVRVRGQGKIDYIISGRPSSALAVRTRSGITGDVVVNDIGLEGLIKKTGFNY